MNPVVLIAGPSASGKSTLARAVAGALRVPLLSLDDYFIPRAKAFVETTAGRVRTFERPTSYDGARLAQDILAQPAGVVGEGFCLFAYPDIGALQAARFYLEVPFPLCLARRLARKPQRPSDRSFQIIGERENTTFVLPQRGIHGVRLLDGSRPTPDLAAIIVGTCQNALRGVTSR